MSSGNGAVERGLLDEIKQFGRAWISPIGATRSETESRRRAARSLERKGLVEIVGIEERRRTRSCAMTPGDARAWRLNEARRRETIAAAALRQASARVERLGGRAAFEVRER